jgi:hypothetical protein
MSAQVHEIRRALGLAQDRQRHAKAELERHLQHEPDEHHARQRHEHTARKLRDDIAVAECDVALLARELARAIESAFSASATACGPY